MEDDLATFSTATYTEDFCTLGGITKKQKKQNQTAGRTVFGNRSATLSVKNEPKRVRLPG